MYDNKFYTYIVSNANDLFYALTWTMTFPLPYGIDPYVPALAS